MCWAIRMSPSPDHGPVAVRVDEYDPDWPGRFAEEAAVLRCALGAHALAIEHIGSTAVPGLPAKPIIDILVSVAGYREFPAMVRAIEAVGYRYTPESEADDPGRRVFRKGPEDLRLMRTHHLHVTQADSHYRRRIIGFRDHLRAHPADAAAYVELKRQLAERFADAPRAYTAGKHEFVAGIERRAGV